MFIKIVKILKFEKIIISSDKKIQIKDKKFIHHLRDRNLIKKIYLFDVCKKIVKQFQFNPKDLIFIIYPTAILIDKKN